MMTLSVVFFFFNDTATTEIYTLSLHDALPICFDLSRDTNDHEGSGVTSLRDVLDRKSTRLNSSHSQISYAVFCLKKKNVHTADSVVIMRRHFFNLRNRPPA